MKARHRAATIIASAVQPNDVAVEVGRMKAAIYLFYNTRVIRMDISAGSFDDRRRGEEGAFFHSWLSTTLIVRDVA